MDRTRSILLVGCGNMGSALLAGWREQGVRGQAICIIEPDPSRAKAAAERYGVTVAADTSRIAGCARADVVLFAVKPQAMRAIVPAYARFVDRSCLFVSIAAGKTIGFLEQTLGREAAVVRAMPNMPAQVRRGITVACRNARTSTSQRALATELLAAVGEVEWVEDESLLDPVTAVSGSGPAYVFLLAECLAQAGIDAGLPPALAEKLAWQTVVGSGALLEQSKDSAEDLRRQVTSPGGTTAAALELLDGPRGLRPLLRAAVRAATARARKLGAEEA